MNWGNSRKRRFLGLSQTCWRAVVGTRAQELMFRITVHRASEAPSSAGTRFSHLAGHCRILWFLSTTTVLCQGGEHCLGMRTEQGEQSGRSGQRGWQRNRGGSDGSGETGQIRGHIWRQNSQDGPLFLSRGRDGSVHKDSDFGFAHCWITCTWTHVSHTYSRCSINAWNRRIESMIDMNEL